MQGTMTIVLAATLALSGLVAAQTGADFFLSSTCCKRKADGDVIARSAAINLYNLRCSSFDCAAGGGAASPSAPEVCPNSGCTFATCCQPKTCSSENFACGAGQIRSPVNANRACPIAGCTSAFCCVAAPSCDDRTYQVINGDFEYPAVQRNPAVSSQITVASGKMSGWDTTDTAYELWSTGFNSVPSYKGYQFAEINAYVDGELSQVVNVVPGDRLIFEFSHRGREGDDTIDVLIGPVDNATTSLGRFTTGNTAWKRYNATYMVPSTVYQVKLRFKAVSSSGSCGISCGNFLDSVVLRSGRCAAAYTYGSCSDLTYQYTNGDFEVPVIPRSSTGATVVSLIASPNPGVPGWKTTDTHIEYWQSGFNGVVSARGNQHAEINAYIAGTLYQEVYQVPTDELTFSFSHRGRSGVDTIRVLVGPKGNATEVLGEFSTGLTWARYSVRWVVPEGLRNITIAFKAVSVAGGQLSVGNFIDAVDLQPTRCVPVYDQSTCNNASYAFVNGDFESPVLPTGNQWYHYQASWVPGWKTTDTAIEFWKNGMYSYTAARGNQWAEINANNNGALYQFFNTVPGDELIFTFSHRGRDGVDTLEVFAGPEGAPLTSLTTSMGRFSTGKPGWQRFSTYYIVPPGQTRTGIRFQAVSTAANGCGISCGNLVDWIVARPRRCA